ncbi:hypothetical protein LI90_4351 (plasmid) [Carbonactinospora thermoautotrophica]|uniref:Uncharacterized protein n=1 Tax=Carbonactinospora thermoautotrophica TaxID=1469144 RepID=A0A132MHY0_9ACTN|nr:hypothetical protein [Carbonactinospora thermoautotrophica]KWW97379.1 hypothetical protein LI90_4351 [Carbonactinospora thermoautotrophica]
MKVITSPAMWAGARCGGCQSRIVWRYSSKVNRVTGKRSLIPLNAEPVDDPRVGNIILIPNPDNPDGEPLAHVLTDAERARVPEDMPRYVAHFFTCPNANDYRRPRR